LSRQVGIARPEIAEVTGSLTLAAQWVQTHRLRRAICAAHPPRGILNSGDLSERMRFPARSVFFNVATMVASACCSAWAQAPAPAKKPPTPPAVAAAPAAPQSKHFPILLLATGNNPAWSLRIGQKGPERLERPGYPPIPVEPAEITREANGDAWTYHAKDTATGAAVVAHLFREPCSDAMSATKYTFRAVVEDEQLGALNGCARIAAELFPRITNQSEDDPDDAAKKKPAPETTVTGFKVPTAVAYINAAGKIVVSRGAVKKIAGPAGTDLALSHDGKKLLYTRADATSPSQSVMVLYDFDTGRSKDLIHGGVKQPFWSPDDSRVAYLNNQDQKWQVWTVPAATPEAPAALYTNNVTRLHGWIDAHAVLASDLQNAYWIADDGRPLQTVALRDLYTETFQIGDSDTIRVNPGNPDLLLVSASYITAPKGASTDANHLSGGLFLYEVRSKRRVALTPPEQSAGNGEWSRDGVQVFYTARVSSGAVGTYRIFWDGSAPKRYAAATSFVIGQ